MLLNALLFVRFRFAHSRPCSATISYGPLSFHRDFWDGRLSAALPGVVRDIAYHTKADSPNVKGIRLYSAASDEVLEVNW